MGPRPGPRPSSGGGGGRLLLGVVILLTAAIFFSGRGGGDHTDEVSGNPQQLTTQLLQLKDDIVIADDTRRGLEEFAKNGVAKSFCGDSGYKVDPLLLHNLLVLQKQGYQVLINNFGIDNDRDRKLCYNDDGSKTRSQHLYGRAVDINAIVKKNGGPKTSWGEIRFRRGSEMQAIQQYADAWLDLLPRDRGGVGQEGCLEGRVQKGGFQVKIPKGSKETLNEFFPDTCNHLHLDVRPR